MSDDAESTSVKLKSKQEEIFEVEKEVACRSVTVKNMVDDTGLDTPVPLPMVDSKILIKVIEYCKYHRTRFGPMRPPAPLFFRPRRLKSAAQASRTPPYSSLSALPHYFSPSAHRAAPLLSLLPSRQGRGRDAAGGREERLGQGLCEGGRRDALQPHPCGQLFGH